MPKLKNAVPKYRQHATGQAVVTIGRRDVYLGKYGTKESRQKYARLIAEWIAADRPAAIATSAEITVTEVCAAFLRFATKHYVKRGEITTEVAGLPVTRFCSANRRRRSCGSPSDQAPRSTRAVEPSGNSGS